eukprot:GDKJ01014623.1.p1 GENE.GDKJ01014623.1~~GDKJ01014623.1.p1  ORF type:complete len:383 (+),score=59.91 GDKJ01014623.1:30-1178(+)
MDDSIPTSESTNENTLEKESGNDLNPHMPSYIKKAPWYLQENSSLKHQRKAESDTSKLGLFVEERFKKGVKRERITKFREGACENCGAVTHVTRDCLERPRMIGAKYSKIFGKDEHLVPQHDIAFDSKRDRWHNYDPSTYLTTRKNLTSLESDNCLSIDDETDELQPKRQRENPTTKQVISPKVVQAQNHEELANQQGTMFTSMRSRTDVAKYLLNLDLSSAMYDPKTRSMRENPMEGNSEETECYRGDNDWRSTSEAKDAIRLQAFAIASEKLGFFISPAALPTQTELMWKEHQARKDQLHTMRQQELEGKYGAFDNQELPRDVAALTQVETSKREIVSSLYIEEQFENGHSSVYGSFWENGKWGYKCCRQVQKNSTCTKI